MTRPGTYVLVSTPDPLPLPCDGSSHDVALGAGKLSLGCAAGVEAVVSPESDSTLPYMLPYEARSISAFSVTLLSGGAPLPSLPDGKTMTLSLPLPDGISAKHLGLLYYVPAAPGNIGKWVQVTDVTMTGTTLSAQLTSSGTYVFAQLP